MRTPEFWRHDGLPAWLLSPLGLAYHLVGLLRRAATTPRQAPLPVICVGNLVAGGAGKTPVVLSLLALLSGQGLRPAALTRGYGGTAAGPLLVDPAHHDAATVGDEALLLAAAAPTWVARDRVAGARAAAAAGANILVMDDGFQNPGLHKDLSVLVIDGAYGFGNGRVIPAGPLRETATGGLARADALVILGEVSAAVGETAKHLAGKLPILRTHIEPRDKAFAESLKGRRVFAFAGIARPEKFIQTLLDLGAEVVGAEGYADHRPYTAATIERLHRAAAATEAQLITTAKDAARLGTDLPPAVLVLDVEAVWDDPAALRRLLAPLTPATSGNAGS